MYIRDLPRDCSPAALKDEECQGREKRPPTDCAGFCLARVHPCLFLLHSNNNARIRAVCTSAGHLANFSLSSFLPLLPYPAFNRGNETSLLPTGDILAPDTFETFDDEFRSSCPFLLPRRARIESLLFTTARWKAARRIAIQISRLSRYLVTFVREICSPIPFKFSAYTAAQKYSITCYRRVWWMRKYTVFVSVCDSTCIFLSS